MKKWVGIAIIVSLIGIAAWTGFRDLAAEYSLTNNGTGFIKGDTSP
ncbi:hypothetical protein [Lysinibacillus sp. 3P01SB]